jgi:hypothetical protein
MINGRMITNRDLEKMSEEAAEAHFICLKGLRKARKNSIRSPVSASLRDIVNMKRSAVYYIVYFSFIYME